MARAPRPVGMLARRTIPNNAQHSLCHRAQRPALGAMLVIVGCSTVFADAALQARESADWAQRQGSVSALTRVLETPPFQSKPESTQEPKLVWRSEDPSVLVARVPLATGWTIDGVAGVDVVPLTSEFARSALGWNDERDGSDAWSPQEVAGALHWHGGIQTNLRLAESFGVFGKSSWEISLGGGWSVGDPSQILRGNIERGSIESGSMVGGTLDWSEGAFSNMRDLDFESTGEPVLWLRIGVSF